MPRTYLPMSRYAYTYNAIESGHPSVLKLHKASRRLNPPAMSTSRLLRHQPFKALYLLYALFSTALIRVPWWCIRYLRPQNRPRASWSFLQAVLVDLHREVLFPVVLDLGYREAPPKMDKKLQDAQAVWIDGLADNSPAFCGEVRRAANINGVRPEKVLAFWVFNPGTGVPEDLKAKDGEKVAIHMHSGAFIVSELVPLMRPLVLLTGFTARWGADIRRTRRRT